MEMKVIARIENRFTGKFGIPRQSGLADTEEARIVFLPEYRNPDALRGIEGYSHLWILWGFSEAERKEAWSPTVRPPRLGGNTRMGVFATRSPYRPNPIGLSSVRLVWVETDTPEGPVLVVSGADLMNGTPIYDIKPYLPYTDCHTDATSGFAGEYVDYRLAVDLPADVKAEALVLGMDEGMLQDLQNVLSLDPRPAYQNDPDRRYGMSYGDYEISFFVSDNRIQVSNIRLRSS
ncbi:MAG: tRNA (N6-threonylcarbamoyladenosine(37)-N6)-methyltransferase TrmO [Lachnospiraceae bacterium]|nr:tRNA (N6-threonylcarbamoyladenosine(37)-N6)-methyltransferase TrmO [Lachnospiraceae bacterium]